MLNLKNIRLFSGLLAVAVFCCLLGPLEAHTKMAPFMPGEKLKYELRWENIPAGETKLEIRPITTIGGVEAYHFVMTTKTKGLVDFFWKLRERVDAYAETGMKRSMGYTKKQTEGEHKRDEVIQFDWNKNKAQYANFGKTRPPIDLVPGSLDPLSAFYYTRMALSSNNLDIERAVTDGKKTFIGKATIVGRQTISLKNGKTYDTWCIIPPMGQMGGVFESNKDSKIYIWVTADERCIPVRIKSKLAIGHFIGELISAEGI